MLFVDSMIGADDDDGSEAKQQNCIKEETAKNNTMKKDEDKNCIFGDRHCAVNFCEMLKIVSFPLSVCVCVCVFVSIQHN